jgi:CheY-like chemotaxis protein
VTAPVRRVLVVEDEPIVAMCLEDMLLDLGYAVVGPATNIAQALTMATQESFDCAILDVNINSERSFVVADELVRRAIPYIFATGYADGGIEDAHSHATVIGKPYRQAQIEEAVLAMLSTPKG